MPRLTMLVELSYYSFVFGVGIGSIKTAGDDRNISFVCSAQFWLLRC